MDTENHLEDSEYDTGTVLESVSDTSPSKRKFPYPSCLHHLHGRQTIIGSVIALCTFIFGCFLGLWIAHMNTTSEKTHSISFCGYITQVLFALWLMIYCSTRRVGHQPPGTIQARDGPQRVQQVFRGSIAGARQGLGGPHGAYELQHYHPNIEAYSNTCFYSCDDPRIPRKNATRRRRTG